MAQHKGSLGGGVFSIREVEYLESLPAVDRVRSGRIVYNDAFKRDCIRRYRNGESPAEIFRSAGLDSALIGYKRIERSIARWKVTLGDDGDPPTVPSPFIVSTDSRWNPSQRRRLNSVSAQPDRRYRYVDDTADTASIDPSEPRQQTMPEPDPRNLIIAQQARRIQELEIEIGELKRARRDTAENTIGGVFYLALFRFRGSGGGIGGSSIGANRLTVGTMLAVEGRPPRRVIYGGSGVRRVGTRSVWKERYARLTSQEERRHPAARVA